jgi:hypothetical protein
MVLSTSVLRTVMAWEREDVRDGNQIAEWPQMRLVRALTTFLQSRTATVALVDVTDARNRSRINAD